MTSNQVLDKVIAHELRHDIKPRVPPSSPTHSALACKQVKKLKKMAIKGSSSEEEEEEACQSSSSDDQEPMNPYLYKQVKKMNKCLKKINSMGYVVFFKDGPHHQLMKVKKKFKKNKQKKEKKPKHESFVIFGEWVSGGEESSSSDESNKKFTTRMGSPSNTCFMAKDMDSDVSDDDSDSPSIDELLDLVHEHQKVIKKQSKEIKNLSALKDLNASLATNI